MKFLHRLDAYGTDDPDFREGHPEDRCPLCSEPVADHPCWGHRWTAARARFVEKIDRALAHLWWHM